MDRVKYVLDTYALFSHFGDNPGAAEVDQLLFAAQDGTIELYVSEISLGEMLYIIERRDDRERAMEGLAVVNQFAICHCPATWPRILAAAHVKAHHPVSYADAFAVALAQEMDASVVTGDPEFEKVEELISVAWLPTKVGRSWIGTIRR